MHLQLWLFLNKEFALYREQILYFKSSPLPPPPCVRAWRPIHTRTLNQSELPWRQEYTAYTSNCEIIYPIELPQEQSIPIIRHLSYLDM